jgi:hypothetical protein
MRKKIVTSEGVCALVMEALFVILFVSSAGCEEVFLEIDRRYVMEVMLC